MKPSDFTQLTDTISNSISQTISNTLSSSPLNSLFKKPKNELEGEQQAQGPSVPDDLWIKCPVCKTMLLSSDLREDLFVCRKCGHHFKVTARQRIRILTDRHSFHEQDKEMESVNLIDFPGYDKKLENARKNSGEKESVVWGTAEIDGNPCVLCVMDSNFMAGSMGTITGEKISRAFEYAADHRLPAVVFTASGGARMQEGILSLMQMAKTSGAVKRHSDAGLLYVTVLTDPTTGGVTASFAMEGDIILAEPGALVAFAGPRVIEQTIRQKLPQGFQQSEFLEEKGFVDAIVHRWEMKKTLAHILQLHKEEEPEHDGL